jgi:hypothetical protein
MAPNPNLKKVMEVYAVIQAQLAFLTEYPC